MRGNSASPLCTVNGSGRPPNRPSVSKRMLSAVRPSCCAILGVVLGKNGVSSTAATRSTSHRLYSTAARRGRLASSFASTQGAVSSMYLLARWMTLKISASAFGTCRTSMHAVTFAGRASTMAASSSSSGSALRWAGRVPPKYFSIIATLRESRLPRSLARSALIRLISASLEKIPSLPNGISRRRK